MIGNHLTPAYDPVLDEYELLTSVGFGAATLFAFIVARRYWRSEIFGKIRIKETPIQVPAS